MKFWEAMKYLAEGKKVKRKDWSDNVFVYLEDGLLWLNYDNEISLWKDTIDYIFDYIDWEIYLPIVKFKDVPIGKRFKYKDKTLAYKVDSECVNVIILYNNGNFLTGCKNDDDDVIYPVD